MKVLVVDDDRTMREMVREALLGEGFDVTVASDGRSAIDLGRAERFDLIVSDIVMYDVDGFELLRTFRSEQPDADVILMTGQATLDAALEATRLGARDYLVKPFKLVELVELARTSEERRRLAEEVRESPHDASAAFADLIGRSPAMIEVLKAVGRVAGTELPVLVTGESGTGKEVIARRIHAHSRRAGRAFVAVNCGALTETLLESELFGHARGAFTGALGEKKGLFEEANGGTIFLDEVTETSPAFQVKLLRVLQEGEVRRVGSNATARVNVRVISASNRDPEALAAAGLFRQDLLFRLNAVSIRVPPLRERGDDVALMVGAFLRQFAPPGESPPRISDDAWERLLAYDWPGNVRELRNMVQRLAVLNSGGIVQLSDLPERIRGEAPPASRPGSTCAASPRSEAARAASEQPPTLAQVEREHLLRVLAYTGGNKRRAAGVLGVDRKTLARMMDRHGVTIDQARGD